MQHLRQSGPSDGGLNGILNVCDVDLIARSLLAVHLDIEVRLAQNSKDSKVLDSVDLAHGIDDLIGHGLEKFEVITVNLHGEFAFDSADRFLHVVGDRLRKTPDDARNFVQFALHRGDHSFLVFVKHRPPLFLGFQVHEVLGIEKTRGIRSVIRASYLARALSNLGKGTKHDAGLVRQADALSRSGAGRESAANPECAFIQVGQKLRADHSTHGEIKGDDQAKNRSTHGHQPMLDRPFHSDAIARFQEFQYRVAPFGHAFAEQHAGENGRDQHGKHEGAEERKGHGPGHGMEQASLDPLQSEDWQVGGNDDRDGVEDRPLDFVRRFADALHRRLIVGAAMAHVADDVLHHDHRAVHNHPEIQRAKGEQVCGNALQLETGRGEQQRKRDRQCDDQCSANISKKQKENDHDQNDAFRKVVQHGMRGVVDQVAAINKRNYLYTRRQNVIIQLFNLGMDSRESFVRICAFPQEHDA